MAGRRGAATKKRTATQPMELEPGTLSGLMDGHACAGCTPELEADWIACVQKC